MTFSYRHGNLRAQYAWLWLAFAALVCHWWFGGLGVGLVCVAATTWLRKVWDHRQRQVVLSTECLRQLWSVPHALCIESTLSNVAIQRLWLLRDEVSATQWVRIRRYVRLNLPTQPLGLSISK